MGHDFEGSPCIRRYKTPKGLKDAIISGSFYKEERRDERNIRSINLQDYEAHGLRLIMILQLVI